MAGSTIVGLEGIRSRCPCCEGTISIREVVFPGMPVLGDALCSGCGQAFWLHWPAGHALLHPVLVDSAGHAFFDGDPWYARIVERVVASREFPARATITTRDREPISTAAVVANCLDTVYGHSVLKVLGALPALTARPPPDLVMIVHASHAWLVPPSVRVIIEVDIPQTQADTWIDGLDDEVKAVLSRYETVEIASGLSQPDVTAGHLALLRSELARRQDWPPSSESQKVTFVLRDDRRWVGHETYALRALRRMLPRRTIHLVERELQNRQVRKLATSLRRTYPKAEISVLGVAKPGGMPDWVADLRTLRPTADDELRWCSELADTNTVVGVHGSQMLLPSALAGAVVDLVPWFKLPNLGQDLVIADELSRESKVCLFRYRMLPMATGIRPLRDVIVSILRDSRYQYRTTVGNRGAIGATDWPRPPGQWRQLDPTARRT